MIQKTNFTKQELQVMIDDVINGDDQSCNGDKAIMELVALQKEVA